MGNTWCMLHVKLSLAAVCAKLFGDPFIPERSENGFEEIADTKSGSLYILAVFFIYDIIQFNHSFPI